jgi:hypothetical protein
VTTESVRISFALSLVNTAEHTSSPIAVEQVVRS